MIGWTIHLEPNARQNGFIFLQFQGENNKSLKPTTGGGIWQRCWSKSLKKQYGWWKKSG